jgi:hypothetical protein
VEGREKEAAVMDSEEEGRDSGEAVMDLVEVEMDSGEAAMVQLAPEVAAKALPEAEETVVAVKVAAVMVKPESEVEVVTVKLAEEKMEVVMVQTEETATEEEGVEEEIRAPREAAASLAQLELAGEEIQEEEEEEIRAPREAMVQSLRLVLAGEEIQEEEEEEEEEALRNRPEIRRAVPAVEITVVAQGVEDLAAAASVKREKEEARPQEQLPRALPVRAVVEVVDSREAMVQSLRLVLAVKLVVAVAEKEEEVVAAATLRQFQPWVIVVAAAATLRQLQPRAIVATAAAVKE